MAKKAAPSPQQERVLIARQDHPDKTATELGELLGISSGAVYQAEGRLREQGKLPSLRRGKGRKRGRPRRTTPVPMAAGKSGSPPGIPLDNGDSPNGRATGSVEEMIADELTTTYSRIESIEREQQSLASELESRQARKVRLEKAQKALVESAA